MDFVLRIHGFCYLSQLPSLDCYVSSEGFGTPKTYHFSLCSTTSSLASDPPNELSDFHEVYVVIKAIKPPRAFGWIVISRTDRSLWSRQHCIASKSSVRKKCYFLHANMSQKHKHDVCFWARQWDSFGLILELKITLLWGVFEDEGPRLFKTQKQCKQGDSTGGENFFSLVVITVTL